MKIKHFKTKEEKEVSSEEWVKIQKNTLIKGWSVIPTAKVPPEVAVLEEKKAEKVETDKKPNSTK